MTIPNVIMHSGQNMYVFETIVESDGALLAKFTCMYCGSGDYVLSQVAPDSLILEPENLWEWPADSFRSDVAAPPPPPPDAGAVAAVPEPATALLCSLVLILLFLKVWRSGLQARNA